MSKTKRKPSNLTNDAYEGIKTMVIRGEIVPGERLNQKQLQDRFNVSRTPLMTALAKLHEEDILEIRPNRGVFVKQLEIKEILDIYKIRLQLEPLGVYEATRLITPENIEHLESILQRFEEVVKKNNQHDVVEIDILFHSEIMKLSTNDFLYRMLTNFDIIIMSNRVGLLNTFENSLNDHKILLDEMKKRNAEKAKETMYKHIHRAYDTLSRLRDLNKTYIQFGNGK
jgi:DNA-binding GntR family transcriptional regulator